jgi:predicted hydrolase (HD superfamily)
MDRDEAVAFCREKCLKETTVRHLISVEGVMRALAGRFDEDPDLWGLTGLFHDLDQDHTGDDGVARGENGFPLLFVDGHSAYTKYTSLRYDPTAPIGPWLDWTVGGLTGEDLK